MGPRTTHASCSWYWSLEDGKGQGLVPREKEREQALGESLKKRWYTLMLQLHALMLKFPESALLRTLMSQDAQWKKILWSNPFGKRCLVHPLQWNPEAHWGIRALKRLPVNKSCSNQHCSDALTTEPFCQATPLTSHRTSDEKMFPWEMLT